MCQTMVSIRVAATPAWRLILRPMPSGDGRNNPPAARPTSSATTTAAATPATRRRVNERSEKTSTTGIAPANAAKTTAWLNESAASKSARLVANEPRPPAVQDDEGHAHGKRQAEGPGMLEKVRDHGRIQVHPPDLADHHEPRDIVAVWQGEQVGQTAPEQGDHRREPAPAAPEQLVSEDPK